MHTNLKIGLEKEFFLIKNDKFTIVPSEGFPFDDSGLLTEARSQAFNSPEEAVFSLQADIFRLDQLAFSHGIKLLDQPIAIIDRDTRLLASRKFQKGLTKYQNLYNFKHHKNNSKETPAGIHISFTRPETFNNDKGTFTYNRMFDWVQLFKFLDQEFKQEIKEAKRNPGFYELKPDGRIEYRSLPANTDLVKIINVLNHYFVNV